MSDNTDTGPAPSARKSKLVLYLAVAYLVLVAYASLYPFSDWRVPSQEVRAFLTAPWPHYLTWADVALNVLAYMPIGLLVALTLLPRIPKWFAALVAAVLGVALSLIIEMVQVYIPARIPSNVDLLCNGIGAIAGAWLAAWLGDPWLLSGELYRLRERWFYAGTTVDVCFLLLALWLVTQLNAEIWLFGNGDVRQLLPEVGAVRYSARAYALIEAGVAALNVAGVGLMLAAISRSLRSAAVSVALLLGIALLLKSLASTALFVPGNPALWVTPGSIWGLAAGLIVWTSLVAAPKPLQVASAATFLALGTALVNAAPENPYLSATLQVWQHGHYASLTELTRALSGAWSFAAIAFLAYAGYRLK
ncbi:MAG: VanZ family protein [Burkholderiales bacterium]